MVRAQGAIVGWTASVGEVEATPTISPSPVDTRRIEVLLKSGLPH